MLRGIQTVGALGAAGIQRRHIDALDRIGDLRGLRAVDAADAEHLVRLHAAVAVAPKGAILAGWAAASALGVPKDMLDGTHDGSALMPVPFLVPERSGLHARQGVRYWKGPIAPEDVVQLDGLLLTAGPRTVVDLARWVRSPAKAQAMVDIGLRYGLTDVIQLGRALSRMKGYRGIGLARDAARAPSARAESPRESELRHHWVEAGLPTPLVNPQVFDLAGRFLGKLDLMDPESGYIGEYDGHWHLVGDRPERDAARLARLRAANLTVDVFTESDFRGPAFGGLTGRLRNGWRRAQERDVRHDFWRLG